MSSPAGWYPDPSGQTGLYRYWTGTAWTTSVTPNPQQTPPPPVGGPQQPVPPVSSPYQPQGQAAGIPTGKAKRRSGALWWLAVVAALVVVALGIWFVLRGGLPGLTSGTDAPSGDSSSDICPQPAASASPTANNSDATRVAAGHLSFPVLGSPWEAPDYDNRVPFGSLAREQVAMDQENYNGKGASWVSSVLVSDLYIGEGFPSAKDGAETVLKCVLGIYYSDTPVTRSDVSSASHSVDGHTGWLIETNLSFSITGLNATSERVLLLVVKVSDAEYSLFYASVPNTSSARLPDVREAMAKLQVDD